MASARYTISLDTEKDRELIEYLDGQVNVSATVREALRSYLEMPSPRDLASKIDQVLEQLGSIQVVQMPSGDERVTEISKAAAGLNAMLKSFGRE